MDLDGGAVVDGGELAAVEGGGGGEEADVEGAGEERGALELDGGVEDVGEEDYLAGVGVREGDEGAGAGHLGGDGVDAPPDPARGGDEGAKEREIKSGVVVVEGPCNGGLLGWECHAFFIGFG